MSLDDAVSAGLVRAQFDDVAAKAGAEPVYETKTYAIGFVLDQVSRPLCWHHYLCRHHNRHHHFSAK